MTRPRSTAPDEAATRREERFRALHASAYADVLRFVQRRVEPSLAEDVVADALLVAWRRLDEAPRLLDDRRAWLFGIARHCLMNTRRGQGRQGALAVRLADAAASGGTADAELVALRLDLTAAWQALEPAEQEAIALATFDGLTSRQAGQVLGISAAAYRLRLMRARRSLRQLLDHAPARPDDPTTLQEVAP